VAKTKVCFAEGRGRTGKIPSLRGADMAFIPRQETGTACHAPTWTCGVKGERWTGKIPFLRCIARNGYAFYPGVRNGHGMPCLAALAHTESIRVGGAGHDISCPYRRRWMLAAGNWFSSWLRAGYGTATLIGLFPHGVKNAIIMSHRGPAQPGRRCDVLVSGVWI
jgi:hypothetical protein